MERLLMRFLLIGVIAMITISPCQNALAKDAQLSLKELKDAAEIVAIIEITATQITNEYAVAHENGAKKKLILHQATTVEGIKGASEKQEVAFLNGEGLIAGKKYIVFLSREKDKQLRISFAGDGVFTINAISMKAVKTGLVDAAKVPGTIALPKSLMVETGTVDKNEPTSYVWVKFADMLGYLQKI